MVPGLYLWLRALVSDRTMAELYERRRALGPTEENRSPLTVSTCVVLLTVILIFLVAVTLTRQDTASYVQGRSLIVFPPADTAVWTISPLTLKACETGADCRRQALAAADGHFAPLKLRGQKAAFPPGMGLTDYAVGVVRLELAPAAWASLTSHPTLALSLPSLTFRRADVYLNGTHQSTFFDKSDITVPFDPHILAPGPLVLEVTLELTSAEGDVVNGNAIGAGESTGLFVTTLQELETFLEWRSASRAGKGDWPGVIARIVMALFVIILFLFIDGSPEALGLSLFLGFEAVAMMFSFQAFPIGNDHFLRHFLLQMGDIMRLYFYLQLARMIDKRIGPWLFWGAVLSVPYGFLREYGELYSWDWLGSIPKMRDFVVGTIGFVVCARAAYFLRDKALPYRMAALSVAAIGCFEQLLEPLLLYVTVLRSSVTLTTVRDVLQPIGAYLFAISAYINVSTLETRVKLLSRAQSDAEKKDVMTQTRTRILERFLGRGVALRLAGAPALEVGLEQVLAPRRAYAALLRADLPDYAALTRELEMEALPGLLDGLFRGVIDAGREVAQVKITSDSLFLFVEEAGGFGDRAAGDVVLQLAAQLAADADRVNRKRHLEGHAPLRLGIGVHFGEVLVGNLTQSSYIEYGAAGPNVSLVQALAVEAAGSGGIVLSPKAVASLRMHADAVIPRLRPLTSGNQGLAVGELATLGADSALRAA